MVNLNLECGREIYVSAFHCSPTYAGLLVGEPDERVNKWGLCIRKVKRFIKFIRFVRFRRC